MFRTNINFFVYWCEFYGKATYFVCVKLRINEVNSSPLGSSTAKYIMMIRVSLLRLLKLTKATSSLIEVLNLVLRCVKELFTLPM